MKKLLNTLLFFVLAVGAFAQGGILKGKVSDALTNDAVAFANVLIKETGTGATTDLDGAFEIGGLQPGQYTIQVSFVGYTDKVIAEIAVTNAKPSVVDIQLEEQSEQLDEVVVRASPFVKTEESPVSLRSIGVAEIQRNPGGNRDISKVVQTLPGVTASPTGFRNDLIIRGGSPNENRFYLDDVEVPNINHFATQGASGGPVGLINVNFIREVDFFSGAFPANRGNTLSSVLNFKQRDGRDDRLGGSFNVSATDIGLALEGPIGPKTTFLVSSRRSYLQFLFQAIGLPFLPTYTDFQAKVKHKINDKNEITFIGLGALDQFELNLDANETEGQQFILDQLPIAPQWNYTNGLVYKHYSDKGYWTFVLSRNMLNNEATKYFQNDDSKEENKLLDYQSQEIENKLRAEHTIRWGKYKAIYGVAYEYDKYNTATFNRIFTASGAATIDYASDFTMHRYGAFLQLSRKFLADRLVLSGGARIDGASYSEETTNPLRQLSPRLSASYVLNEKWSINANTGIYFQLPAYTVLGYQASGVFVNKENDVRYIRNQQAVLGLEWNPYTNAKITLEGYYKKYDFYPFLLRDSLSLANRGGDFGVVGNEPIVPTSNGRTYGVELLFQQRLFRGFYGIVAYTLGVSEFSDKNGELIPSAWDARHIVNTTVGKKFGKNWEFGVNWRFQTGVPTTPFSDASSLVQNWNVNGRGIPDFNRLNTLRTDALNSMDIRLDKKWFFDRWSLNVFLDVENVNANAVGFEQLILDRPLDADNRPIGQGIIENPGAPLEQQRYKLKSINDATGAAIPSVGVLVDF